MNDPLSGLVKLDTATPIWERFFCVFPLTLVGSKEEKGGYDLAPKHLAMPMSWENHYGFVCSPLHATYRNIQREGVFTVSYPKPAQVVATSLAASPRCEDQTKPDLLALPTVKASKVDGVFIKDAYLCLECELDRIIDEFGENSLITGKIVAAHVDENALRQSELEDQELLRNDPLLAYLYPGRFTEIRDSFSFPFPSGFKR